MAIKKSEIISNTLQAHGVRDITECHTDHVGKKHYFNYSVLDGTNLSKRLSDRVPEIEADIKQGEIDEAVNVYEQGKIIKLDWATDSEIKPFLQEREAEKQAEITKVTNEKANITDKITEIGVI